MIGLLKIAFYAPLPHQNPEFGTICNFQGPSSDFLIIQHHIHPSKCIEEVRRCADSELGVGFQAFTFKDCAEFKMQKS